MCTTCGCSTNAKSTVTALGGELRSDEATATHPASAHAHDHAHDHGHAHHHGHAHDHVHADGDAHELDHDHGHAHDDAHEHAHARGIAHVHPEPETKTLLLEQQVLAKNGRLAERNRGWFEGRAITALNLMSSPGAGKTTLLEVTIRRLAGRVPISVIEGDQETVRDAERIRATGCPVVQINTGSGCHLDAEMLAKALRTLDPPPSSLLLIENVGNLVCPALFDLGEHAKVVIASVTEGEDKPLKYPHMFRACETLVLNKVDLIPHVEFNIERFLAYARRVNPRLRVFQLSATRGDGLDAWCSFLLEESRREQPRPTSEVRSGLDRPSTPG